MSSNSVINAFFQYFCNRYNGVEMRKNNKKWDELLQRFVEFIKLDDKFFQNDPNGVTTVLYNAINEAGFKLKPTGKTTLNDALNMRLSIVIMFQAMIPEEDYKNRVTSVAFEQKDGSNVQFDSNQVNIELKEKDGGKVHAKTKRVLLVDEKKQLVSGEEWEKMQEIIKAQNGDPNIEVDNLKQ